MTTKVLRCLFWGVLAVFAVALAACLGLRYLVLPKIDQWRPRIEQYASQSLGSPVRIGSIAADWSGLNPRLRLSSVQFYDGADQPEPTITLPSVAAVVAWRSVLRMTPRLLSLDIEGADLTVRRDAAGLLWVAGMSFDPAAPAAKGDSPVLVWLSQQRQLSLSGTTLHWLDEQRQAPELVLSHVDAAVRNGALSHRFALHATPPAALSAGVTLRGEIERRIFTLNSSDPASWNGNFYMQLDDAEPYAWSPWVTMPAVQGRLAARAWVQLTHGQIGNVTLDAVLRGLDTALPHQEGRLAAKQAHLRLDGMPGDLDALPADALPLPLARSASGQGMSLQVQAQGLAATLPTVFDTPDLRVDDLQVDASLLHPPRQPLSLDLRQLQLKNGEAELQLQGRWRDEGAGGEGTADLQGKLVRMAMPAIHRYLPLTVSQSTRHWMAQGLQAGEVRDASVVLKGPLAEFPFTQPGETGQFRVAGRYQEARVDYAPARPDRKGWPVLSAMSGPFVVDRASLTLDSAGGVVETGPSQQVVLHAVHAAIPNMEHDAQLDVTGESSGAVPAYLAMATNSPLGGLLDGALDQSQGSGDWQVAMKLHVPLLHPDDAQIDGHIVFQGNTFQLLPQLPAMSALQGDLAFSDLGLQANDIRGTFLGGPARVSGKLGHGESLAFSGTLAATALDELGKLPAWQRFSGKTAYQGKLSYAKGGDVDVSVQSDLSGLAIDLPAPLGKTASATLPLALQWSPATNRGHSGRRWLSGGIGENINLLFERDPSDRGAYFARGAIGVGRPATLPTRGLNLAGTLDTLDTDAWNDALKSFSPAPVSAPVPAPAKGKAAPKPAPPALPGLELVNLSVKRLVAAGQDFDDITLYAQRPAPQQWRVSIDAKQAAGTLEWAEASDAASGKITARFDRLALGKAGEAGKDVKPDGDKESELSDIPGIDLQAKQFVLYGHDVGSLDLVGTNLERGNLWRLDKLHVANESATLDATGSWRLSGTERGLSADASIDFKDLGAMLERLGLQSVSSGHGTIKGKLFWRNLPWRHDKADIEGTMHVNLEKGRFVHLSSRTSRVLELLSLQSLQRLATLSANPAGLLREGFPFDSVTGDMRLTGGVMSIDGYKVNGPVAAIGLEGRTDIIKELWDLHAVVVPNLDASGAAIAAALVNPVIGLGAFITQWLLKQPLARAMTSEYHVTGSWDDPKVETVETKAPAVESAPATH
ncbi:MAG TPA: YhdP family protein [Bordetella sp.]